MANIVTLLGDANSQVDNVHVYIHVYMHVHVHVYIRTCMCTCTCTCILYIIKCTLCHI